MNIIKRFLKSFFKPKGGWNKACKLMDQSRFREAANILTGMILEDPKDIRAHQGLAMSYAMAGNEFRTRLYADVVAKHRPDWARMTVERATDVSPADYPMYGPFELTKEQTEANQKFVEDIVRQAGSRENGAKRGIERGWEALNAGDLRTAMRRFNQAWLFTPEDPVIFWGFGCVSSEQSKHDQAIVMMREAKKNLSENGFFLSDFARAYLKMAEESVEENVVEESLKNACALFGKSARLEPSWRMTFLSWGIALARRTDFVGARDKFATLGRLGEPVDNVINALDLGVEWQTKGVSALGKSGPEIMEIILRECQVRLTSSLWADVGPKPRLHSGQSSRN